MKKKSFKDINPVMQFITQEPAQSATDEVKPKTLDQNKNIDEVVNNLESVGANTERAELDRETKSKRLNLLVKPSILDDVKKIAVMRQVSVNDLINQLLDQHRTENHKDIESFNKTFSK
jgi:hypothetical protein